METDAYQQFVTGYLEALTWAERKDGIPLELLNQLSDEERERAVDELIERLSIEDTWPIIGLGHLRSRKAVPKLRDLLAVSQGKIRAAIATAIWKIEKDEEMLAIVLQCSSSSLPASSSPYSQYSLIDIVYCLAEFPGDEAKRRLEELSSSEEYLVSCNAKRALRLRTDHYEQS